MNAISLSNLISERDLLRQEWTKVKIEQYDVEGQLDTIRESIFKLTHQIKATEKQLNKVQWGS